jgi:hypothetical protein
VRSPSSFTNGVVALRSLRNGDRAVRLHSLRRHALDAA